MKKFYLSLALLASTMFGFNEARADVVDNYTMDFNKSISTSAHDFKVGSGWGHLVESYYDEDEYETVYVSYSYESSKGRNGSGALRAGSQSLGSGWGGGKQVNDLLVTPAVNGTSSIWVKKYSNSGSIKFFVVTKGDDGKFLKGDEIEVDASNLSTSDWTKVEIPAQENQLIGIRANNVYIDDFEASQADVELQRALTITRVTSKSESPDCDTDGRFPVAFTVEVQNTGDLPLAAGDDGYSLSIVNYSKDNTMISTTPLKAGLAIGDKTTVDITGYANYVDFPGRCRYDVREDLTQTTKYGAWIEPTPYKPVMQLRDDNGRVDNGASYAWGMVSAASSKSFSLSNNGAAPLEITEVVLPDGFTTDLEAPCTIAAHEKKQLNITMPATTPGIYSGVVTIKGNGVDDFTLNVSGTVLDKSKFFADFEDGKLPLGSYAESGWSVEQRDYTSSDNAYLLSNGSQDRHDKFVTPLLKVADGEKMAVDVARTGYTTDGDGVYLEVYYSPDRTNWTLARKITADELSSNRANSTKWFGELSTFVIDNIPAGNYYIGFGAGYTCIDNIYGFEKVAVAHDLLVAESKIPAKATVNNKYEATAKLRNINVADEAADSYTATLFVDGEAVATSETPKIAAGGDADFTFSYTPHKAGAAQAYIEFKNSADGYTVATPSAEVAIAEETASAEVTIGTGGQTLNITPIRWYDADNNSGASSDVVYRAEMLKKYGLKAGAKISSITFTGTSSNSKSISELNMTAYAGTVDDSKLDGETPAFVPGAGLDGMAKVDVYKDASFSFQSGDEVTTVITLPEPIVWDGESAIRVVTHIKGSTYVNVQFPVDNDYKTAYSGRGEIEDASYSSCQTPIAVFGVQTEPSKIYGKVMGGDKAVAGATVTLTSGDVVYTGTTDEDGNYSIEVIQNDKTYTLTVVADGYSDFTEDNIDMTESVEKNINMDVLVGISTVDVESRGTLDINKPMYNVAGQRVDANYRGIVLQNGRKFVNK